MKKYSKIFFAAGVFTILVSIMIFVFGDESVYEGAAVMLPLAALSLFFGYAYEHHPEKFNFKPLDPHASKEKQHPVQKYAALALVIFVTGIIGIIGVNVIYAEYGDIKQIATSSIVLLLGFSFFTIIRYYNYRGYSPMYLQKVNPRLYKIITWALLVILIIAVIIIILAFLDLYGISF